MTPLAQNTLLQNRYLVGQMIGQGGMGEVYLAIDQRVGGPVVIKRTYFAGDDVLGGGFENEARALGRLRHQALPKVSDHFVENGEQFLVMDHVAGDDLSKRLATTQTPFPLSWVMFWADQLLDALVYLHSNEPAIVHRDIKPQNLKLTENNNVVLLDFGLSRKGVAKLEGGAGSAGFAKPYAPLEQIRGAETNPRSDIFSFSATLYFLLTNVVPPDATQRADAVLSGRPDPLRPISQINPEVPASVSEVIQKGMAVSQDQRFADARSMQKALREAFARMNEATSEKTVVMNAPVETSPGEAQMASKEDMGAATIPFGMVVNLPEPSTPAPAEVQPAEFDATIRYDGPIIDAPAAPDSTPKQADIKTEVFISPNLTFDEPSAPFTETPAPAPFTEMPESFGETPSAPAAANETFLPDATVPIVNLDAPEAPAPHNDQTGSYGGFSETSDFSVPASPFADGGFSETPAAESFAQPEPEPASPAAVAAVAAAPEKKKTSKGFLIGVLIALFLLMILGAGGAGLAWYVYSGKGSLFGPSETPTPLPTPSASPTVTATPTPDESNTSNQNGTVDSSPSPTVSPEPTATPATDVTPDRQNTPVTRPTNVPPTPRPTQVTPQTPRPTIKPTVKPSAKPTLRGREIPQ